MPAAYKHNVYCLDYSFAKEGKLVEYSFDVQWILDKINALLFDKFHIVCEYLGKLA